jgi:hypothetical protein
MQMQYQKTRGPGLANMQDHQQSVPLDPKVSQKGTSLGLQTQLEASCLLVPLQWKPTESPPKNSTTSTELGHRHPANCLERKEIKVL